MPNQETQYHVAERIATITLNRPDKLNAWTAVMEQEVRAAMAAAESDENVRVIVLTGAGRGFCAGADMSLLSTVATKGLDAAQRAQAVQAAGGASEGTRRGFSEKIFVLPGAEQAGHRCRQRSSCGLGTGDCFILRFAVCFGCGALQHRVRKAGSDRRVWHGVDVAAPGGTCQRSGFIVFRTND